MNMQIIHARKENKSKTNKKKLHPANEQKNYYSQNESINVLEHFPGIRTII